MFSSRDAFENDFCPVRDELLGDMYRANANGLPLLVESVSSEVRAMLALFCYRRSHLHSLALVDRRELQRARTDPVGRPRRLHPLRAVPRTRPHARAVVVLRPPQADHALDQAALDLRADRRRSRRGCRGSRDGLTVVPAKAGTHNHRISLFWMASATAPLPTDHAVWVPAPRAQLRSRPGRPTAPAIHACGAPSRIRHRRACRSGRPRAAPRRSCTTS